MTIRIKIISGGQTGVDRAALDAALAHGVACGGWCPADRRSEDGRIPRRYPLIESASRDYRQRTAWNVRDSDATLVLNLGRLAGGTLLTVQIARERFEKPCLVVQLERKFDCARVCAWLARHHVKVLNVAGPRASKSPQVAALARIAIDALLTRLTGAPSPPGCASSPAARSATSRASR